MTKWLRRSSLDSLFEDLYLVPFKNGSDLAVDLYEDNGNVIIEMNLPGILAKDVSITTENHYVRISGQRQEEEEKKGKNFYKKEIHRGSFERVIELPCAVDESKASAEFKNGILKVTLPKKKEAAAKQIHIKSEK
jgi:HSP20 family protein